MIEPDLLHLLLMQLCRWKIWEVVGLACETILCSELYRLFLTWEECGVGWLVSSTFSLSEFLRQGRGHLSRGCCGCLTLVLTHTRWNIIYWTKIGCQKTSPVFLCFSLLNKSHIFLFYFVDGISDLSELFGLVLFNTGVWRRDIWVNCSACASNVWLLFIQLLPDLIDCIFITKSGSNLGSDNFLKGVFESVSMWVQEDVFTFLLFLREGSHGYEFVNKPGVSFPQLSLLHVEVTLTHDLE